ncbi:MAG: hypothetical protein ACTSPI_06730 [Candidatus Heimdallarchaeaceae archaeon]
MATVKKILSNISDPSLYSRRDALDTIDIGSKLWQATQMKDFDPKTIVSMVNQEISNVGKSVGLKMPILTDKDIQGVLGKDIYAFRNMYKQKLSGMYGKENLSKKISEVVSNYSPGSPSDITEDPNTFLEGGDITGDISYEDTKPSDLLGKIDSSNSKALGEVSMVNFWTEQMKSIEERLKTSETQQKSLIEKLTAEPEVTREEALEAARKEAGIPEKLEQLQEQSIKVANLQGKIDQLSVEQQQKIDASRGRLASEGAINAEIDRINMDYDSRKAYLSAQLSGQAALMKAYQGNYNAAKDNAYQALLVEQKNVRDDKQNVMRMMLDYPDAGITIDDTVDSAVEKAQEVATIDEVPITKNVDGDLYEYDPETKKWNMVVEGAGGDTDVLTRMSEIDRYMQSRVGTDGLISAETYNEALKLWRQKGGSVRDFELYYPPEAAMRPFEIERLHNLYPSVYGESEGSISNEDLIRF